MKLSIIIPTLNRPSDLRNALDSISKQTLLPNEVIVIDQSDNDLSKEVVGIFNQQSKNKDLVYIWHHRAEKSSAKARNEGFRLSSGDLVFFTDDDIVFDPDYIKNVVRCFNTNPDVGCVSGSVVIKSSPKGLKWNIRSFLMRTFMISFFNGKMTPSGFGFPIFLHEIKKITQVELLAGYSMNFRRKLLEDNAFDEWFTGYSFREDVELSYRMSRITKIVMIPDARFEHIHSQLNRMNSSHLKRMEFKNYRYLFLKHKNKRIFSKLLFYYSIAGLIFIDFLEFLFSFKKEKYQSFQSSILSVWEMALGRL
ncbi:conserved hypothetical protein [Candidatus Methylobacter favarea]|uniref:Glycosyltransferase 2-like domain-containing protein n=1 Tax=Candidatus Methylobacter favarea TaxID=2707345 RepID=A0A8S0WAC8_9GAMM|nr:glycosyltransferase family 2 protein [Candidatus Methylobacter favarea]CAA9890649.1 conserved hypothetical protein [Candidatus Methylobacter favarea]